MRCARKPRSSPSTRPTPACPDSLPASRKATPARSRQRIDSRRAVEHLRNADPVLRTLIDELGPGGLGDVRRGRPPTDHYGALVRSIVGQQLSTKAARAIYGRLEERFDG